MVHLSAAQVAVVIVVAVFTGGDGFQRLSSVIRAVERAHIAVPLVVGRVQFDVPGRSVIEVAERGKVQVVRSKFFGVPPIVSRPGQRPELKG